MWTGATITADLIADTTLHEEATTAATAKHENVAYDHFFLADLV